MTKFFGSWLGVGLVLASPVVAQTPQTGALAEAAQALQEKIPQVAMEKLRKILAENPTPEERALASRQLGRAVLDDGRPAEALPYFSEGNEDERLWKAEAFSALGRWSEAEPIFRSLATGERAAARPATLGLAESLRALGKMDEAIWWLESLNRTQPDNFVTLRLAELFLDKKSPKRTETLLSGMTAATEWQNKWKTVLEGRALLLRDQAAPALIKFEEALRDPRHLSESLLVSATIGATEARIALNGREAADDVIEDFIWRQPESVYLEEMFTRLDQIYAGEENPSESELQKWSQKPPRRRAALALFYLVKAELREKKIDKALRFLNTFVRDYPDHPFVAQAYAWQGSILLPEKPAAAVAAYEAAMRNARDPNELAEMELAAGLAHFRQHEFLLAANLFHSAAARAPQRWEEATYNAALAWLNLGNYDRFLEDYQALSARAPESPLRRDLLLEEGLLQARSGDARAEGSLQLFLHDFPQHPRATEARTALAEIRFLADDQAGAAQWLRVAHESAPGSGNERGDYLAIFVADAAGQRDDQNILALAQKFLHRYGDSPLVPEVRMKMGQVYFRREDFANAETQFETLAATAGGTPLAETALFLAGQSALHSMNAGNLDRALDLFGQAAKLNGPLKLFAQQEQAVAKARAGQEGEAVLLYDAILHANPGTILRFAALSGKADNLLAPNSAPPEATAQAVALYQQIAADPEVTIFWRNQALYKKAKCLEKQGDKAQALTAFYEVLQPFAGAEPEFFWYFKAGFDAARLLEAQEKWPAAIGLYDKMAKSDGPRAEEARARASELRLEHFIWTE